MVCIFIDENSIFIDENTIILTADLVTDLGPSYEHDSIFLTVNMPIFPIT